MSKHIVRITRATTVAAVLLGCGSDGPRWAKRADQIDMAAWEAVCGKEHHANDDDGTSADFPYHEETFRRPSPAQPEPFYPMVSCDFARHAGNQRLFRAYIRAVGRPTDVSPEFRASAIALFVDVLPPAVRPTLHEVAASQVMVKKRAHGFQLEGGESPGVVAGGIEWEIRVRTTR